MECSLEMGLTFPIATQIMHRAHKRQRVTTLLVWSLKCTASEARRGQLFVDTPHPFQKQETMAQRTICVKSVRHKASTTIAQASPAVYRKRRRACALKEIDAAGCGKSLRRIGNGVEFSPIWVFVDLCPTIHCGSVLMRTTPIHAIVCLDLDSGKPTRWHPTNWSRSGFAVQLSRVVK